MPNATYELNVELPEYDVKAVVTLFRQTAPTLTELVWEALDVPLEGPTGHAAFNGEELFVFMAPFTKDGAIVSPPVEAWTMWPKPGDLMFFYKRPDERVPGGTKPIYELCFMYGETDLRHFYEKGQPGSLIGHMTLGHEEFADACRKTRINGRTTIRVTRRSSGAS